MSDTDVPSLPSKITTILLAEEWITEDTKQPLRITIGLPMPIPNDNLGDWYCLYQVVGLPGEDGAVKRHLQTSPVLAVRDALRDATERAERAKGIPQAQSK
ncbi:MAG: hypothetical protein AAGA48_28395 [Myxococcota bacterium]